MHRIVLFPRVLSLSKIGYIPDFVNALNAHEGITVVNAPSKNPLLSILNVWREKADTYIFNWPENIPGYKYGKLQTCFLVALLICLKLTHKNIVWFFHNKWPHDLKNRISVNIICRLMAGLSKVIITHAEEGCEILSQRYPFVKRKVHFLDHPTKDRLDMSVPSSKQYDLLIWGGVSEYKGVLEFVSFLKANPQINLRVCIIGKFSTPELLERVKEQATGNIFILEKRLPFEQLGRYMAQSRFVLCTYKPETVLSSMMLMDSLSFGCKVIGPDTGSFKDYVSERRINVYTYRDFSDINGIVSAYGNIRTDINGYREFLTEKNWPHFVRNLLALIDG